MMAPGVTAATGDPQTWERELFRQQVVNGDFVGADFNLPMIRDTKRNASDVRGEDFSQASQQHSD